MATLSFCSNPKVTCELLPSRDSPSLNVGIGFLNLSEELNISLLHCVVMVGSPTPAPSRHPPHLPRSRHSPNPDPTQALRWGQLQKLLFLGATPLIQGLFLHLGWQTFPPGAKSFVPLTKSMFYSGICREEGVVVEGLENFREVRLFGKCQRPKRGTG